MIRCLCKTGYKQHPTRHQKCVDFDECAEMTAHCPPNSNCKNRNGGYECKCNPGFTSKLPNIDTADTVEAFQCVPDNVTTINKNDSANLPNKNKNKKKKKHKKKVGAMLSFKW